MPFNPLTFDVAVAMRDQKLEPHRSVGALWLLSTDEQRGYLQYEYRTYFNWMREKMMAEKAEKSGS